MKVQLVSDVHCEFWKNKYLKALDEITPTDARVLIVAGDLFTCRAPVRYREIIERLLERWEHVILVAGNHEFYRFTLSEGYSFLHRLSEELPNFYFLERQTVTINGIVFAGATLWFPEPSPIDQSIKSRLNDFHLIEDLEPVVYRLHELASAFFKKTKADVFISHHLPHKSCQSSGYANDRAQIFYWSDQSEALIGQGPAYWVFGHQHISTDHEVGVTRVLSNPYGYKNYELNSGFVPDFTFEVEHDEHSSAS